MLSTENLPLLLMHQLEPNEQIWWCAKPEVENVATRAGNLRGTVRSWWNIVLLLGVCLTMVSWYVLTQWDGVVLSGLALGAFLFSLLKRNCEMHRLERTAYAVTNRRVMLIEPGAIYSLTSFRPSELGEIRIVEHTDGSGNIIFGQDATHLRCRLFARRKRRFIMRSVAQVAFVARLMRALQDSALAKVQNDEHVSTQRGVVCVDRHLPMEGTSCALGSNPSENVQDQQGYPTWYERYIWAVAQERAAFSGDLEMQRAFQAYLVAFRVTNVLWCGLPLPDAEREIATMTDAVFDKLVLFELPLRLVALCHGGLTMDETVKALRDFGDDDFVAAMLAIEQQLDSEHAIVRANALQVLAGEWQRPEHLPTVVRFLNDPSSECRRVAVNALEILDPYPLDQTTVAALARIVADQQECEETRLSAYWTMLNALSEQKSESEARLDEIEVLLAAEGGDSAPCGGWQMIGVNDQQAISMKK